MSCILGSIKNTSNVSHCCICLSQIVTPFKVKSRQVLDWTLLLGILGSPGTIPSSFHWVGRAPGPVVREISILGPLGGGTKPIHSQNVHLKPDY